MLPVGKPGEQSLGEDVRLSPTGAGFLGFFSRSTILSTGVSGSKPVAPLQCRQSTTEGPAERVPFIWHEAMNHRQDPAWGRRKR